MPYNITNFTITSEWLHRGCTFRTGVGILTPRLYFGSRCQNAVLAVFRKLIEAATIMTIV